MKKISTIEFSASLETIRSAVSTGTIPPELLEPLQSLATPLMEQITRQPTGVYLLSSDENKELRDLLGSCIALALLPHFKTTLLVDSDFLNVGMGDIVPHRDSLGFLDLLLYGSSMKAIVQRAAGGFYVIGAGSFQVTKKLPFSIESFQSAVRYLLNQAQCVIFSGPAEDDTGTVQPMAELLHTIIYIRQVARSGGMPHDQLQTKLTPLDEANLFTVSVILEKEEPREEIPSPELPQAGPLEEKPGPPAAEIQPVRAERKANGESGTREQDAGAGSTKPAPAGQEALEKERSGDVRETGRTADFYTWDTVEEPHARDAKSSLLGKIAMGIIPIVLVAFLFWWLFYTKSYRDEKTQPVDRQTPVVAVLTDSADTDVQPEPADTTVLPKETPADDQVEEAVSKTVEPDDGQRIIDAAGEPEEADLVVYDNLAPMSGRYLIHISSFRAVANAESDARYLLGKGFEVFIARIDLKAKGVWYRVYVGPYDTRDEARENKLKMDTLERVKFSRITKAP